MASANSSLLRRMRVRLNFPEDLATNWKLPFPNWLHLVDPLRTSTVDLLTKAITSKWRPSSSSTTVYLSIGGYRLDANDPVDILRDDDVLDVMSAHALSPVPRQVSSHQNQVPAPHQQQLQQHQQPQQQHQSNHQSLSNRRKRLSVFHADRSNFGLDLEEAETTQYYGGGATNGAAHAAGATNEAAAAGVTPDGVASVKAVAASRSKRKTAEMEEGDGKHKTRKRPKSQTENPTQMEINATEMVVPAVTNGATQVQDATDGAAGNEASPIEKKKKRTRRPKKGKGFDLTLSHVVQNEAPKHAPTKIPFKIANADADSLVNRSHIVFGEENSFMELETADEIVERQVNKAKEEEEATEEEEEEEETDELMKQRAIGEEDVNGWSPIGNVPKEGDIVAFKVMEMDENYCPQISDFKIGLVKSNQGGKDRLQIRLFNFTRQKVKGKFEMRLKKKKKKGLEEEAQENDREEQEGGEELVTENELRKTVPEMTIQWNSVIEPKLRPAEEVQA